MQNKNVQIDGYAAIIKTHTREGYDIDLFRTPQYSTEQDAVSHLLLHLFDIAVEFFNNKNIDRIPAVLDQGAAALRQQYNEGNAEVVNFIDAIIEWINSGFQDICPYTSHVTGCINVSSAFVSLEQFSTLAQVNTWNQDKKCIPIKGYQWYLDGYLVCWSNRFFLTEKEVLDDMQMNVLQICQEIADNSKDNTFVWDNNFMPDTPDSCDDFAECLQNFERIRYMVSEKGRRYIYAHVTDAGNPLENNCPYEISWHVMPYAVFCG